VLIKLGELELGRSSRVCGVIVGSISSGAVKKALGSGADLLELRVDTFADRDPVRIEAS